MPSRQGARLKSFAGRLTRHGGCRLSRAMGLAQAEARLLGRPTRTGRKANSSALTSSCELRNSNERPRMAHAHGLAQNDLVRCSHANAKGDSFLFICVLHERASARRTVSSLSVSRAGPRGAARRGADMPSRSVLRASASDRMMAFLRTRERKRAEHKMSGEREQNQEERKEKLARLASEILDSTVWTTG